MSWQSLKTNGIYLGVVSFMKNAADPGDLMREGSPQWVLVLFGVVAFPLGLFVWNGLGPYFGLGEARGKIEKGTVVGVFACLAALVVIEVLAYAG
jgi:hypothetical protein